MPRKTTRTPEEKKLKKAEYMRDYYLRKKPEITEVRYQKMKCEVCYGRYTPAHKAQHERSIRHQDALQLRSQTQSPEIGSDLKT